MSEPSTSGAADGEPKQYKQLMPQTPEEMAGQEFFNNCFVRSVLAGGAGGVMGVAMGVLFGSMDMNAMNGPLVTDQTTRQVLTDMAKNIKSKSVSYAKGFAVMGFMFSGTECMVEKFRAKTDIYNSVYAGCLTGGALAASGGPQAMCVGCVTFAAFSALIDKIMMPDH